MAGTVADFFSGIGGCGWMQAVGGGAVVHSPLPQHAVFVPDDCAAQRSRRLVSSGDRSPRRIQAVCLPRGWAGRASRGHTVTEAPTRDGKAGKAAKATRDASAAQITPER